VARDRDKAASHERIIRQAAAQVKRDGPDRLSVDALMRSADLTHGGFYRHFASRQALLEEAISAALSADETSHEDSGADRGDGLRAAIEAYVNTAHRDAVAAGCSVAALAGDVTRGSAAGRAAFAAQVEAKAARLGEQIEEARGPWGSGRGDARREALLLLSAMVGSLVLSRAAAGSPVSGELIEAVREQLLARYPRDARAPQD
jgi:TetR/AcrR family transcriptional repressor of nem operon